MITVMTESAPTTELPELVDPYRDGDLCAPGPGDLCDLLDRLRAEVAFLDTVGLPEVARMAAYERLVRNLVTAAISDANAAA